MRNPLTAVLLAAGLGSRVLLGAPFTPGNIVISQIGDDEISSSGNASPVHLLEISVTDPDGTIVQDIALPTVSSAPNHRFALTSYFRDGHLKRSANGLFLTIGGYDASLDPNDSTSIEPNGADPALVPRVIARIDPFGIVDTATSLTDAYGFLPGQGGLFCVVSSDGRNFWMAGRGEAVNRRVSYAAYGASTSMMLTTSVTNSVRSVDIFDGQLYAVINNGGTRGPVAVGTGLPTESGQSIDFIEQVTLPDGLESGSPYDHFWFDADTVYVTDDRTVNGSGGVHKYTRDTDELSPTFGQLIHRYILTAGLPGFPAQAVKTMDGRPSVGNPAHAELFIITGEDQQGDPTRLMRVVDTGCPTGTEVGCSVADTFATLQTAPEGTDFRGVALAPRACVGDECIGQCCLTEGCQDTTLAECQALNGLWRGLGTSCATETCPLVCPTPYADADVDGDVDMNDFGGFQKCYAGPGIAVGGMCRCFDRPEEGFPSGDGDVDAADFAAFQACAGGANLPPQVCD